jgi:hypothetical protein
MVCVCVCVNVCADREKNGLAPKKMTEKSVGKFERASRTPRKSANNQAYPQTDPLIYLENVQLLRPLGHTKNLRHINIKRK